MKTYAEYLRELGATSEEIAILDTPTGRRAYDKMQADLSTASTERDRAVKVADDTRDWFDNVQTPEWNGMNAELIAAKAEAARFKTALRTAQDRGLLNITKDLGLDDAGNPANPANPNPGVTPPGFDPTKYVTREQLVETARQEGAAIAIAQDIASEHSILFPGQRLNFAQLRDEALAARKPVMQHWMDKYKVSEARAKQEADRQAAHDKKIADDAVAAARSEWVKNNGSNPDLRTPAPSSSPFTVRKTQDDIRSQQPWARNESALSNDRVQRAVERQQARESGRVN